MRDYIYILPISLTILLIFLTPRRLTISELTFILLTVSTFHFLVSVQASLRHFFTYVDLKLKPQSPISACATSREPPDSWDNWKPWDFEGTNDSTTINIDI